MIFIRNKDFQLYSCDLTFKQKATRDFAMQTMYAALKALRRYAINKEMSYIIYYAVSDQHVSEGTRGNNHIHSLILAKNITLAKYLEDYWTTHQYAIHDFISTKECWNGRKMEYILKQTSRKGSGFRQYWANQTDKTQAMSKLGLRTINKASLRVAFDSYMPPEGRTVKAFDWWPIGKPLFDGAEVIKRDGKAIQKNQMVRIGFIETN